MAKSGGPSTLPSSDPEQGSTSADAIELVEFEHGVPFPSSSNTATSPCLPWHPKITPYRFITFLTPICLGTAKAVAAQRGNTEEPITLEWIAGVVVFLVLFNAGTYESHPLHHVPWYLSWLFKPDCMDGLWWLLGRLFAVPCPKYSSEEMDHNEPESVHIVTSYRLLVSATVFSIGMLKASLTYSGLSTGANWVEWVLGVVITSILYFIGLYENNSVGLWSAFFGRDRAYVVRTGLKGTSKLIIIVASLTLMSLWFAIDRPKDGFTETELPLIFRAYNRSVSFLLECIFVVMFVLGGAILFASLRSAAEDLGDNVPLPVRRFLERAEIFAMGAPLSVLRWFLRHVRVVRHLLALFSSLLFLTLWLSFTFGYMYRASIFDVPIHRKWNPFVYFSMIFASLVVVVPTFFIVRWAGRELLSAARRGIAVGAVNAVIALTRLENADVHYGFSELGESLRGSMV
ncbi:hypothetical protein BDZ97DRAFT_1838436 [Flammula alnicola]|nr:hypothetical protein BDZ97DRAFT_1838436 [Flammula alnicola]